MVHSYNRVLFSNLKERTDTWHNMDEPQKHWAIEVRPKDYILYESSYMKWPEKVNLLEQQIAWGWG